MQRFPSFGCSALVASSILPPSAAAVPHLAGFPPAMSSMLPLVNRFFALRSAFGLSSPQATAAGNTRIAANGRTFFDMGGLLEKDLWSLARTGAVKKRFLLNVLWQI